MNYSILKYILGYVLKIEAAFMLLPCVTSLIYHRKKDAISFSSPVSVCFWACL